MKVYNYSDKPVVIKGAEIKDTEFFLPAHMERWIVKHNNQDFIPPTSSNRNAIVTIRNTGQPDSYSYKTIEYKTPDIWVWIGVFLTFFSFYFWIRIVQKIKTT